MPKLKQPSTLGKLAVRALGRAVGQRAVEAIASGVKINTGDLQDYLYGELPDVLSQEVTAHMLTEVAGTLTNGDYYQTDVSDVTRSVLLGVVCRRISVLDLSNVPHYALETLSCNIQTFVKLHSLIFPRFYCPVVAGKLAAEPSAFKFLVHFRMPSNCTDAIIRTFHSCCYATIQYIDVSYSRQVTDASLRILLKCLKLTHISIYGTRMTPEGFVEFLEDKSYYAAEGILGLAVGSWKDWNASSKQLNAIALCCPMLKKLDISVDHADMVDLLSLTKLEALRVIGGHFTDCHLDSFLRVRGSNITSFELQYTRSIDLACILNHCVNIRTLSVGTDIIMGNLENAPNTCQNLEVLNLSGWVSPTSIERLLCACVNLKSLYLNSDQENITDELILCVLSKNPLQKLTNFTVHSHNLTMRSVDAVIEHCPLLEELRLIQCRAITDEGVKILRQKIQRRNQDLRIYCT